MTDDRTPDEDRNLNAAEYALGVLTGEDLAHAHQSFSADPSFRSEVGAWTGRFARFLGEVADVEPPRSLWRRIAAERLGRLRPMS